MATERARIAVLASHGGTTLQALIDAVEQGTLNGELVLVISNNSTSGALTRARTAGIAALHLSGHTHPEPGAEDIAITTALQDAAADWVVLAGYMKRLQPITLRDWQGHLINTHPALLPRHGGRGCYGDRVHQAVLDQKETHTGVTIHRVTSEYDRGPILAQARVPVLAGDNLSTLRERVQRLEKPLLIWTLNQCISGAAD